MINSKKKWATAISKNKITEDAIVYRFIHDFDFSDSIRKYFHRIIIVWEYTGIKGMPDIETNRNMKTLENILENHMDEGIFSILAIVSTGNNLREWTYYAKSEDEFFLRLNNALSEKEHFPIQLHAAMDLNWDTYKDFKSTVTE